MARLFLVQSAYVKAQKQSGFYQPRFNGDNLLALLATRQFGNNLQVLFRTC